MHYAYYEVPQRLTDKKLHDLIDMIDPDLRAIEEFDERRGLWVAQLMFQRKMHLLCRFKTKREAINARKAGEEKYFGKYR